MRRVLSPLLLMCGLLPGCARDFFLAESPPQSTMTRPDQPLPMGSFDLDVPAERAQVLSAINREEIQGTLQHAARGSHVHLVDTEDHRYIGTLLRSGPEQVELLNCMGREAVPGPDGQRQCKTTHVPFQTLPVASLTHCIVLSGPPPNFPATDDEIDGQDLGISELVYRSGRRQSWSPTPDRYHSPQVRASAE